MRTFKVLLLGEKGVGKTTWLNRLITREFSNKSHLHIIKLLYTSSGPIEFVFTESTCIEHYNLSSFDAILYMYSLAEKITSNDKDFIRKRKEISIPVFVCGTKYDIKIHEKTLDVPAKCCVYISSKSYSNYDKPLLFLARELMEDQTLVFTGEAPVIPVEIKPTIPTQSPIIITIDNVQYRLEKIEEKPKIILINNVKDQSFVLEQINKHDAKLRVDVAGTMLQFCGIDPNNKFVTYDLFYEGVEVLTPVVVYNNDNPQTKQIYRPKSLQSFASQIKIVELNVVTIITEDQLWLKWSGFTNSKNN